MTRQHSLPFALRFLAPVALRALLLLALSSLLLGSAHAQSATATLSGTVEDTNGAVIPNANVIAINTGTRLERRTTTNDQGGFVLTLLPPSTYVIRVESQGFGPVEVKDLVLNVGDQKALQIQLKAGDVNATVTVSSDVETVRTDGSVGTVVDRQFVSNLPLSGRSFQSLLELTPGVTLFKSNGLGSQSGQFSVNGQRTDSNYFMVDGVSANTGIYGPPLGSMPGQSASGQLPSLTAVGTTQSLVSVDALQEFRVQTSTYAPQFGRTPGGQISLVTRSGSNSFHGTLFEYFRNEAMDAQDWFANANRQAKPPDRQHDFGGTFSGPIFLPRFGEGGHQAGYNGKNRTFFFFSYEGLRLRLPQVKTVGVPTVALRQQVPAAVATLLNMFPQPNGNALATGIQEFSASYADPAQLDATAIRIDHSVGSKATIFGRYSHTPSVNSQRGPSLNSIINNRAANYSLTLAGIWLVTSKVTNDVRANWTVSKGGVKQVFDTLGGGVKAPDEILFRSPFTSDNAAFSLSLNGTSGFGLGVGSDMLQRQLNIVDSLTVIKGAHSLGFGVDYRRISPILSRAGFNYAFYSFGAVSNAQAGRLSAFTLSTVRGGEDVVLYTNLSTWGQDTWRVTPRLTLTYGVRWELNPPPRSVNDHQPLTVEDVNAVQPLSFAPKDTPMWRTTFDNIAPRTGVAWQISQAKGRETVVRGGFGLFYDTGFGVSANSFNNAYPFWAQKIVLNAAYPLSDADAQLPAFGSFVPTQLFVMDRKLKLPYTYQWNVSAEQSLGSNQTLSISYVGAAGRRLLRYAQYKLQYAQFGATRVNTNYSTNGAISDYKALQVQFQRRLSKGFQALLNYTLSKSKDISSDNGAFNEGTQVPANLSDPELDYAPSTFDARHVFTAGTTYNIPTPSGPRFARSVLADWGLDSLVRVRSAFPLNPVAVVFLATGGYFVRPNIVPGVPQVLTGTQYPGGKRINPAAFSTPAAGTIGNNPRNSLRGFPAQQVDMTLRRQFTLSERVKLQFRFDVFNVFNHPNFADPALDLRSPGSFGLSSQMLNRGLGGLSQLYQIGGPRSGQVSAKLLW